MSVSVDRLTSTFFKIKQKREELSREFKEADAKLSKQQDKIKQALLDYCKENEVESVRTSNGTFFRSVKTKYWTNDWDSMYKFILEHEVPEFFTKNLNQTNIKQFLEENPEVVPPGLNAESEYVISIRKGK